MVLRQICSLRLVWTLWLSWTIFENSCYASACRAIWAVWSEIEEIEIICFKGQHFTKFHVWNKITYTTKMTDLFQSACHLASFHHNHIIFSFWFPFFFFLVLSTFFIFLFDYNIRPLKEGMHPLLYICTTGLTKGLWVLSTGVSVTQDMADQTPLSNVFF